VTNGKNLTIPDMNAREIAIFLPLIAWAIWIGVYPKPYFEILQRPVAEIVERVRPGYFGAGNLNAGVGGQGPGARAPELSTAPTAVPASGTVAMKTSAEAVVTAAAPAPGPRPLAPVSVPRPLTPAAGQGGAQ